MSLELLPWQPVANGSLGFPLHLHQRFLGISFPWQRMALIPPGPPPWKGTKKLLFPSSQEFLVGKKIPATPERFFWNAWSKNS